MCPVNLCKKCAKHILFFSSSYSPVFVQKSLRRHGSFLSKAIRDLCGTELQNSRYPSKRVFSQAPLYRDRSTRKNVIEERIGIFAERLLAQRSAKICRCLRAKPEFEFSFADFSVIGKSNIVAPLRCA